jgi:hypothetical protein
MASPQKPSNHIGAHSAEPNHSELHYKLPLKQLQNAFTGASLPSRRNHMRGGRRFAQLCGRPTEERRLPLYHWRIGLGVAIGRDTVTSDRFDRGQDAGLVVHQDVMARRVALLHVFELFFL